MRIAFITYEFPSDIGKGGIGTYVQQISAALAKCDVDVHVFSGSFETETTSINNGVAVHRTLCTDPISFRKNVVKIFEKVHSVSPFDLIESPEIHGNAWEIKTKYPAIPMIVRLHAPNYLVESLKKKYVPFTAKLRFVVGSLRRLKWSPGYWKAYQKDEDPDYTFTKLADAITAPSEAMKQWAVENWNFHLEDITVIPNLFSPSKSLLDISVVEGTQYKRIVFFGRLNVLKGLVNATRAMKKILSGNPDWRFRIIGDDGPGPKPYVNMRSWMKKELAQVSDQIEFFDGVPYEELPTLLADCEIVVLPSLFESFSYTCAEAMAAGKAVVGSKNGGMVDLLENGKNGALADPDSYLDIYNKISALINNPETLHKLSLNGRKRIINDYEKIKRSSINFYQKWKKK